MGIAFFQKDAEITIEGKAFVLKHKVDEQLWQVEETKTRRMLEKSDKELRDLYVDSKLVFVTKKETRESRKGLKIGKVFRETPVKLFDEAKARRLYAKAASDVPQTQKELERVANKVWAEIGQPERPPHWTTVYRWRKRYVASGKDINGVVAQQHKRGNRKSRYPVEVIEIAERAIDTEYLTLERKTVQDAVDKALIDVKKENKLRPATTQLLMPTRRLIQALISKIPAFDRCVARYGRTVAVRRFRSVQKHQATEAPLQRCEVDHTLLDLMVIDDKDGMPLGRPLLTACIDDFTRCVLGIAISFEPPSFLTVARCLKHAFLPKTNLNKLYKEIVNAWEAYGVCGEVVVDQGQEFYSKGLEEACLSMGCEILYSPRKTPWFKGKIERFLGTMNREVTHVAPGTTFANIFEKGDYDPAKHAVVRLSTLKCIAHKWIADVYHQRPHRTLKMPPAVMWQTNIHPEDIPVPEDPAQLDALLGRRESRVLTHKGIELEGLFYNSHELRDFRKLKGERIPVEICINDGDVGAIVVLHPDSERMFIVPALKKQYAQGLSMWQHKVCKRFADRQMSRYDPEAWLEAKNRIAEMIREDFALAKGKGRKRAARWMGADAGRTNEGAPAARSEEGVNDRVVDDPVTPPSAAGDAAVPPSTPLPPPAIAKALTNKSPGFPAKFKPEWRAR